MRLDTRDVELETISAISAIRIRCITSRELQRLLHLRPYDR